MQELKFGNGVKWDNVGIVLTDNINMYLELLITDMNVNEK